MTQQVFIEWVNLVFGLAVKKYLPLRALIILDNAPAHPPSFENDILCEGSLPTTQHHPYTAAYGSTVTSNSKELYTKHLFLQCFEVTESTNLTLKEFWRDLKLLEMAWHGVSRRTLTSVWRKLWPDAVAPRDFKGFEPEPEREPMPESE